MGYFVDNSGLTVKRRLFCEEWLSNGHNATHAAIKAGYSKKAAYSIGYDLLKIPDVQRYINRRMKEIFEKVGATTEWRAKMLKEATEACLQGRADKDGVVNARGLVATISEMNKMEGIYPADKEAKEVKVELTHVSEKVSKYEKEF